MSEKTPLGRLLVAVTFLSLVGLSVIGMLLVLPRLDPLFERVGLTRDFYLVADYGSYYLSATDNEFFAFASGHGNPVAQLRVEFPNNVVREIRNITANEIADLYGEKATVTLPSGITVTRFKNGSDSITFSAGKAWGIEIGANSKVAIDFGDGHFVTFPVRRDELSRIIGDPKKTTRQAIGAP